MGEKGWRAGEGGKMGRERKGKWMRMYLLDLCQALYAPSNELYSVTDTKITHSHGSARVF